MTTLEIIMACGGVGGLTAFGVFFKALKKGITGDLSTKITLSNQKISRDIKELSDNIADVKNAGKDTIMRVSALELLDTQRVERIVRLEANQVSIEKGQTRIETALKDMKDESARGRAELIDTIREMSKRDVR